MPFFKKSKQSAAKRKQLTQQLSLAKQIKELGADRSKQDIKIPHPRFDNLAELLVHNKDKNRRRF